MERFGRLNRLTVLVAQIPSNIVINTSLAMVEPLNKTLLKGILNTSIIFGMFACKPVGQVSIESNNSNNNREVDPISTLTDLETAEEVFENFVAIHPEYKDREASVISFRINGVSANTVVMKSTDKEKEEINNFINSYKDFPQQPQPYNEAVVFTMKTDEDDQTEWVRLSGVWYPTTDGSTNTAWYYSPNAFDVDSKTIKFDQMVFAFNSLESEYVFYPLVTPPSKLLWSDKFLTSNKPGDFEMWDGIKPYVLPVYYLGEGATKTLFVPIPPEETVNTHLVYSQQDLEKMGNQQKIDAAPEIDGLEKARISSINPALVIYVNEKNEAIRVYNLTTSKESTPVEAGIIEFYLTDETIWEVKAFKPNIKTDTDPETVELRKQESVDEMLNFIISDGVAWGNDGNASGSQITKPIADFIERLKKIPNREPVGGTLYPFDLNDLPNQFGIAYSRVTKPDGKEATIVKYAREDETRQIVYIDMSIDDLNRYLSTSTVR